MIRSPCLKNNFILHFLQNLILLTGSIFIHTEFFFLYRFSKLSDPAADRRQQLEDSLTLQQFCRDVEDELQWIKEHRPLAESADYGKSLVGVQNLQKKHQVSRPVVEVNYQ